MDVEGGARAVQVEPAVKRRCGFGGGRFPVLHWNPPKAGQAKRGATKLGPPRFCSTGIPACVVGSQTGEAAPCHKEVERRRARLSARPTRAYWPVWSMILVRNRCSRSSEPKNKSRGTPLRLSISL